MPTDFTAPSGSALNRVADQRARQFWDPHHLVAQELTRRVSAKSPETKPACCLSRGFYWDDALLFASQSLWRDDPPPAFWNGPVVRIIPSLESALRNTK